MISRTRIAFVMMLSMVPLSTRMLLSQESPQTSPAGGQSPALIDQQIDMMRKDIQSQKRQVIAANMKLTDAEAEKFWPLYEQYVKELVKVNDAKYALIKEYLQNTQMTEEQADGVSKRWVEVDASVVSFDSNTFPFFAGRFRRKVRRCFFNWTGVFK